MTSEYSSSSIRKGNKFWITKIYLLQRLMSTAGWTKILVYRNCIYDKKVKSTFLSFLFYVIINMFCQSEVAVHRCSSKMVLLKISLYSQKTPALESLLNKVVCNFIENVTPTQALSCEYCEILRAAFFIEHLGWVLLLNENTIFFFSTVLLFIHVWHHFQLKAWNQEGREVTKNLFLKLLFQHLKNSSKDACEDGSFHFYCKPAILIKLIKIPSYVFFPDFATTQNNLFEIIGNDGNTYLPECLRMAASVRFCYTWTKWKWFNLFFHWCGSEK